MSDAPNNGADGQRASIAQSRLQPLLADSCGKDSRCGPSVASLVSRSTSAVLRRAGRAKGQASKQSDDTRVSGSCEEAHSRLRNVPPGLMTLQIQYQWGGVAGVGKLTGVTWHAWLPPLRRCDERWA